MTLNVVVTSNTILAADINQLVYILARQTGQTEIGSYFLTGNSHAGGAASVGYWVSSLSRISTPVSVAIDTSLQAVSSFSAPSTDHLTANGFHVYANTTGDTAAANVGGLYTIQY